MKRRTSQRWHPMIVPARIPTSESRGSRGRVPTGSAAAPAPSLGFGPGRGGWRRRRSRRAPTAEPWPSAEKGNLALCALCALASSVHSCVHSCVVLAACPSISLHAAGWRAKLQGSRPALGCHVHGGAAGARHGADRQHLTESATDAGGCHGGHPLSLSPQAASMVSWRQKRLTAVPLAMTWPHDTWLTWLSAAVLCPGPRPFRPGSRVLVRTPNLPAVQAQQCTPMASSFSSQDLLTGTLGPQQGTAARSL